MVRPSRQFSSGSDAYERTTNAALRSYHEVQSSIMVHLKVGISLILQALMYLHGLDKYVDRRASPRLVLD